MTAEEKYPLLIGHSLAGRTRLHNIHEVANFICVHGQCGDLIGVQNHTRVTRTFKQKRKESVSEAYGAFT